MGLANYQQDIVNKIYNLLIEDDFNKGNTLYGETGTGKSTISLNLAKQLQETWSIFYIKGMDPNLSPYLTWHIGTKLYSKTKLSIEGDISFGVNLLTLPISIGGTLKRDKENYILTQSEEALILSIKKQAGVNKHILFIVDDYEFWDIPSKQLLQKITLSKLELFNGLHIVILLISREKKSIEGEFSWNFLPINKIEDDDILFILRNNKCLGHFNISDIRLCAGNDLSLAIIAARYYDDNGTHTTDFNKLMEDRCKRLNEQDREVCSVLVPLSIIDSCFTKDETAFFINPSPDDVEDIEYQAEDYLSLAEKLLFIVGEESYCFTNQKVKEYFKTQLSNKEKRLHRKFSNFLRKHHSEDYFSRGKHLKQSLMKKDIEGLREAWQLLFLSYIRRASEVGNNTDIYNILSEIRVLLKYLAPEIAAVHNNVLEEFLAGYQEFSQYSYKEALQHLQVLTPSQLVPACLAEWQRLILLCHLQLADNPNAIKRIAEELYDTIESSDFDEDEQYCRAALVLLNVYTDRVYNELKLKKLKNKLIKVIHRHPGHLAFDEFDACFKRKAALCFPAIIALRQTDQSVQYYRNRYSRNGLYMALCNHMGNAIVSGDYNIAKQVSLEYADLMNSSIGWHYPSRYKFENNDILLIYLQEDEQALDNREMILDAAQNAAMALEQIVDHQQDEVSHVILLNYLGLSGLYGSKNWVSELEKVNHQLVDADEYYQYYLHDLNFASAIFQYDLIKAQDELAILKKLDPPLLRDYKKIFSRRRYIQEELLSSPEINNIDPVEYHKIIKTACAHIQDSSCKFFGRGFLLSDLQFLSF